MRKERDNREYTSTIPDEQSKIIALAKEMSREIWQRNMMMGRTMPRLLHGNNINGIWKKILGRPPSKEEFEKAMAFYRRIQSKQSKLV